MRRHEHRVDWRSIGFYGFVSVLVLVVGATVLVSFFERQQLRQTIAAEALPNVTVVTTNPASELAAAWVSLLGTSDLPTTLVSVDKFQPTRGVVAICEVGAVTPAFRRDLERHLREGGGVLVIGVPPRELADLFGSASHVSSEGVIRVSDAASPVLARVQPGHQIGARPSLVAALDETPSVTVDARWSGNARAAIAHFHVNQQRVLWVGFDPSRLFVPGDRQLALMLRTGLRWAAGQAVSEGAVGEVAAARTLTPAARLAARNQRFSWSADRLQKEKLMSLRLTNRGTGRLLNPTVKVWLPAGTSSVSFSGSFVSRRRVNITTSEDGAVIVTLPMLERHEERLLKMKLH